MSAALLEVVFLVVTSDFVADLGVSVFGDLVVEDGRLTVDSVGFLEDVVTGFTTSG